MAWAWILGSFTVAILIGVLFLWVCSLIRRLARSRFVIRRFDNPAYKEIRCPSCTLGAQYLGSKGWGPIPHGVRMIVQGRNYMGPPQANIRKCPSCAGNGYTTTRDTEVEANYGLGEVR